MSERPNVFRSSANSGNSRRLQIIAAQVALLSVFLLTWQLGSGRILDPFYFSSPTKVVTALGGELLSGGFWRDFRITVTEMLVGFAVGGAAGTLTGLALGRWPLACAVLEPFFVALNGIPRVALAPLLVIWFGIDLMSKIALAASLVYFITLFNTLSGVRSVDGGLISVARIHGATSRQLFLKVVLPSASTWILTGLKLSLPFALIGVIVGEFMAAAAGLGYRLNMYSTSYNTTGTMAMLIVMMFLMLGLNFVMKTIENRLMRWRPEPAFGTNPTVL